MYEHIYINLYCDISKEQPSNLVNSLSYYPFVHISAKIKPFKIGVNFDATETCTIAATSGCEWDAAITSPMDPSGTTGFKLQYWQVAC